MNQCRGMFSLKAVIAVGMSLASMALAVAYARADTAALTADTSHPDSSTFAAGDIRFDRSAANDG